MLMATGMASVRVTIGRNIDGVVSAMVVSAAASSSTVPIDTGMGDWEKLPINMPDMSGGNLREITYQHA
jgi:hypothetical protein